LCSGENNFSYIEKNEFIGLNKNAGIKALKNA